MLAWYSTECCELMVCGQCLDGEWKESFFLWRQRWGLRQGAIRRWYPASSSVCDNTQQDNGSGDDDSCYLTAGSCCLEQEATRQSNQSVSAMNLWRSAGEHWCWCIMAEDLMIWGEKLSEFADSDVWCWNHIMSTVPLPAQWIWGWGFCFSARMRMTHSQEPCLSWTWRPVCECNSTYITSEAVVNRHSK